MLQGSNEGEAKGSQCPGRKITGGDKNSQQRRKYFLQYSKFVPKRPLVRIWGLQTLFLHRAPANIGTPLRCCPAQRFVQPVIRYEDIFQDIYGDSSC